MKHTLSVSFFIGLLLIMIPSTAGADESVKLLEHCSSNSKVINTFTGLSCHQVTGHGPSFALVGEGVAPLFYATTDCTGSTSRVAESSKEINFCKNKFDDGNPLNDKVRSVRLVKTCPVNQSFSQGDYCFEGGRDKASCCVCPPGTRWSNVSANYRQCIN